MGVKITFSKNPYIVQLCPTFFRFFRKDIGHGTSIDIKYGLRLYFIRWATFTLNIFKTWDMGHKSASKKNEIKLDISLLYREFFSLYNVFLIFMAGCPT
jgi:hypothetical protein